MILCKVNMYNMLISHIHMLQYDDRPVVFADNYITSHNFLCVVRIIKIHSLSNLATAKLVTVLLTMITLLCSRSPGLFISWW